MDQFFGFRQLSFWRIGLVMAMLWAFGCASKNPPPSIKKSSANSNGGGSQQTNPFNPVPQPQPQPNPGPVTPAGSLTFSNTMANALAGTNVSSFRLFEIVHGVVRGGGSANAYGCAVPVGNTGCDNFSNWTHLPTEDWTFNASDQTWRMSADFLWLQRDAVGDFVMHFKDLDTKVEVSKIIKLTCLNAWYSTSAVIGPYYPPEACDSLGKTTTGGGGNWVCDCR